MVKTTEYTAKCYVGQLGDMATEWCTQEDLDRHEEYIKKCKADGTYGNEFEVKITLINCPEFDSPSYSKCSYSYVILNFDGNI